MGSPYGQLALERPGRDGKRLFHVLRLPLDGLGPLYSPAVHRSRRATLESPNLTAYHFGPSLDQPRMAYSGYDVCECLVV